MPGNDGPSVQNGDGNQVVLVENSRSVAHQPLPPIPLNLEHDAGTILLCYQYKEPVWTNKEHKRVLKKLIEIGLSLGITGRGRVAPEGVNMTLSGTPQNVRQFCEQLRAWDPLFLETDFKLTDGIPSNKLFKSLSIRKTEELVAYGLAGEKAPSLEKFAGTHLTADDYHNAMQDKDTVIIDVRNAYESTIGHFQPPKDGAKLLDPKMRNSIEFPKWLNAPETQKQLHNKKVLMYCTGGIRCERATALLNQLSTVNPDKCKPQGVYHMRGGIERYVQTFPEGGFWKGKNYLFDRRREQVPGAKEDAEEEVDSKCCVCRCRWTSYRGKFKCASSLCGVPVIVCPNCDKYALDHASELSCELCKEGYRAPEEVPDLVGLKRQAEEKASEGRPSKKVKSSEDSANIQESYSDRLFVARLPLTASRSKIDEAFGGGCVKELYWIKSPQTGAFYGSCIVQIVSPSTATAILIRSAAQGIKIDKKRMKISPVYVKKTKAEWPPADHVPREYPPVGVC